MNRAQNCFLTGLSCLLWAQPAPGATPTVTLTATPASLSFNYVSGAALPAAQTLAVKASSGTPSYTVAITGSNSLWLTATPEAGKVPASLKVQANPTSLAVGNYSATVVVTAGSALASIPVTLVVTSPQPTLAISATALAFTSPPIQPAPQNLRLSTSGGPVSYTATASGGTWLSITPNAGVVLPGEQAIITVSVDASVLSPQAAPYIAKITIVASGVPAANKTQNVTVTLTANSSAPTITSLWPSSALVNSPATTVTIRGRNFYSATVAKIQGVTTPLATTVLSPGVLLAVIPPTPLSAAGTLNLLVSNPAPGGDSAAATFTVSANPLIQAVVNAATNAGTSISPGELITLYGANIGPSTPAGMTDANADGIVDTALNGVSVTIDGLASPLLYVSANQISCQVPYAVTTGTAKSIVVSNGSTTATGASDITLTAPGLFTLDGSGTGQAAALNYNSSSGTYTLNQANAPARIGDTVLLYLTGEGDYATSLNPRTGLLVPASLSPLPQLNPLPGVTIGGAAATVQYAGPLTGSILGLLQLNVTVPSGATTGTAVPVVVTVGSASSQAGVTLSIKP